MKKVVCPYCTSLNEINEEENLLYCKVCSKGFSVSQGERLYSLTIMRFFNNGNNDLYVATRYGNALKCFEKVLSLDPHFFEAISGLILATLFTSTIVNSRLVEVNEYLLKYKEDLLKHQNTDGNLSKFYIKLIDSLKEYEKTTLSRLSNKDNVFYEGNGLLLYKKLLDECLMVLSTIKDLIQNSNKIVETSLSNDALSELEKELLSRKENKYSLYEGKAPYLLDTTNKKQKVNIFVFKDNRSLYKRRNHAIIGVLISFLIFIVGLIFIFSLKNYFIIGLSVTSVGLVGLVTCYLINLVLKKILYKNVKL